MTESASPVLAFHSAIEDAAELVRKAKRTVVLTGAGISTPSGIPDFRSEGTGLWSRDEPLEVASLNTFRTAPERFFSWFRPLAGQHCRRHDRCAGHTPRLGRSARVRMARTRGTRRAPR